MDGKAAVTREPDGPTEAWLILERLKDLTEQNAGLRRWVEQEIKDLRQEVKDVRQEIKDVRQEVKDVRQEVAQLREEVRQEIRNIRQDMAVLERGLRDEIAALRRDHRTLWVSTLAVGVTILAALIGLYARGG